MDDLSTIVKYIIALVISLVLAVVGFRIFRSSIDMIRYGSDTFGENSYVIENTSASDDYDDYDSYDGYDDEDAYWQYYEDDQPSEEELREMDERIAFLEENTDFEFFEENFIYLETEVGEDYLDLFFDDGWMIRQDYDGYYGEDFDERMEFWIADSEEFDVIAYVFNLEALLLYFPDDGFYMYYDVDKETFAGLLRTDSQDEYYDKYIRDSYERKWLGE